jgi:protein-disulfide isomerase
MPSSLRIPVTSADHISGDTHAPVTLVEYGDYECPYCRAAHGHVQLVQKRFGRDLCYVFRHFPLTEIHPNAEPAAESAEFAGVHGRFWDMHDGIYENQEQLGIPLLLALAQRLGMSAPELQQALAAGIYEPKVRSDFVGGARSGVNATPTFFINGHRHDGPFDFESLSLAIEATRAHARV